MFPLLDDQSVIMYVVRLSVVIHTGVIDCVCPTPRLMALRSFAQSVGCHRQSLMPLSVVILSGKASWRV